MHVYALSRCAVGGVLQLQGSGEVVELPGGGVSNVHVAQVH